MNGTSFGQADFRASRLISAGLPKLREVLESKISQFPKSLFFDPFDLGCTHSWFQRRAVLGRCGCTNPVQKLNDVQFSSIQSGLSNFFPHVSTSC